MADADDNHNYTVIVDVIEDTIVTNSKTVTLRTIFEFLGARWAWILGELINRENSSTMYVRWQTPQLTANLWEELNLIFHAVRDRAGFLRVKLVPRLPAMLLP